MVDEYAQDYAASHASFAKVRAKMPRAAQYHEDYGAAPPVEPKPPGGPVNIAPPVIEAAAGVAVGETVTRTSFGTWQGNPFYASQWLRDTAPIFDATGDMYTLVQADAGAMITLGVTGTNDEGSAAATSNALGPVTDV
jgi:hypothetical protein